MATSKTTVIIVGGIPCVGKSSICASLAKSLGIGIVLSGDYLREFIRPIIAEDSRYTVLNTSVYDSWKKFGERNKYNIVKGYLEQGEIMSRGINATVERALKNGERMIVETLYFIPDFLPALSNPGVLPFYIQVSDPKRYEQMVLERKDYTHPGQPGDRLLPHLDAYRFMAEYSIEACKKKGIKVFDNTNYKDTLTEISKFVESKWHS